MRCGDAGRAPTHGILHQYLQRPRYARHYSVRLPKDIMGQVQSKTVMCVKSDFDFMNLQYMYCPWGHPSQLPGVLLVSHSVTALLKF